MLFTFFLFAAKSTLIFRSEWLAWGPTAKPWSLGKIPGLQEYKCHTLSTLLGKAMAPHSSTPAWKIPGMEEPGGLQSMGSLRVGHDWATSLSLFTFTHWRRKWQCTPVFLPGESQGWGILMGCHLWGRTVGHDWRDLAAAATGVDNKAKSSFTGCSRILSRTRISLLVKHLSTS